MLLIAILALFIVVPLVEIWLILEVAQLLGGGTQGLAWTIAILLIDSMIGAVLVRNQGRTAWLELRGTINAGRLPTKEAVSGGYVLVGSTFLLLPGFLSDIVGVIMLLPVTRRPLTNRTIAVLKRRIILFPAGADSGMRDFARSNQPPRRADWHTSNPDSSSTPPDQVKTSN